jgi:hypothetical protein
MSKGSFKVVAELVQKCFLVSKEHGYTRYLPAGTITMVEKWNAVFNLSEFENVDVLHDTLVESGHVECKTKHEYNEEDSECLDKMGLYIITTNENRVYVVDPSENDHMERFLAGTDDLVHELRYNPAIRLGGDVQEAESHSKKHKPE